VSVVLVGNKTDLAENRVVTEQMGRCAAGRGSTAHTSPYTTYLIVSTRRVCRRRAREWDVLFCECSATTNEGLDAFLLLVGAMMTSWQRPAGMATPYHVPSEALLAQLFPPPLTAVAQPSSTDAEAQQQWCVLQ
jgi:hypothetical protein